MKRKDDYANKENRRQTKEKEKKPSQQETTMTDQLTQSNIIQILKATDILRAKTIPRTTPTEVKRDKSSRRTNKIKEKRNPNHRSSKNRQNETTRNHTCPLLIKEGRCKDQEKRKMQL